MSGAIIDSQAIKINGIYVDSAEFRRLSDEEEIENIEENKRQSGSENGVKTSSLRTKRKYVKKSKKLVGDLDSEEEQEKSKPKRKSRLSLNSEVKHKTKVKEDCNQGSIKSFFQTLSPRSKENLEELNKSKDEAETENVCKNKKKDPVEENGKSKKLLGEVVCENKKKDLVEDDDDKSKKLFGEVVSKNKKKDPVKEHSKSKNLLEEVVGKNKKKGPVEEDRKSKKLFGEVVSKNKKKDPVEDDDKSKKLFGEVVSKNKKKDPVEEHSKSKNLLEEVVGKNKKKDPVEEDGKSKKLFGEVVSKNKKKDPVEEDGKSKKLFGEVVSKNKKKDPVEKDGKIKKLFEEVVCKNKKKDPVEEDFKSKNLLGEVVSKNKKKDPVEEDDKSKKLVGEVVCNNKKVPVEDNGNRKKLFGEVVSKNKKKESVEEDGKSKKLKKRKKKNGFKTDDLKEDDNELKKVTFSEDVQEFSPQPTRKNSCVIDAVEETEEAKNKIRNAFTFMMDSRHKSIGQNSPGKDPEKLEESPEAQKETKKKLSSRKAAFEEWANSKGAKKRKLDDEETAIVIEHKLKKRAKRLKKLLTNIEDSGSKRKCKSEEDDDDELLFKPKKPKLLICSDNSNSSETDVLIEDTSKKNNSTLLQQTELSNFFTEKPKNKLQMKRKDSESEKPKNKKNPASKLTLKKTEEINEAPLTPNSIKQWKMKLKVSLENVEDEDIEKSIKSPKRIDFDDDEEKVTVSVELDSDDEPLSSYKKKPIKLAPLFVKSQPKPKVDEATIEARRKFLHSSIPDSLKKTIDKQQRVEELDYQIFPTVSHIFVKPTLEDSTNILNFWALPKADLQLTSLESYSPTIGLLNLGSMTSSKDLKEPETDSQIKQKINLKSVLKRIKTENPDYPVYKAFKFLYQKYLKNNPQPTKLKKSKRRRSKKKPEIEIIPQTQEIWTDLYKPNNSEEIFGNASSISQFKTWLETWLEFSEEVNSKRRRRTNSDSDFETDGESKDSMRLPGNTVIFTGPHGSGKTTAVYALCNELGINVLEINASSKRTGKRLLQELQEATQSHQVRKTDTLNGYFKKNESQISETNKTPKMCLLLIEDIDIAFEQDDNFITALGQLVAMSKRPIVLTTTDLNCLHLKKFVQQHSVFNFTNFSPKILATWFQIICLIEGVHVDRQTIVEVLERNKGDVRRTLLQLQFWVQSGGQLKNLQETIIRKKPEEIEENLCRDDDSSNISWLNDEEDGATTETVITHRISLQENDPSRPVDLGDFWWKIPAPLIHPRIKLKENSEPPQATSECLKNVSDVFESLTFVDLTYQKLNVDCDLEPVHSTKTVFIKDSLELNKSLENYTSNKDLAYELSNTLLDGYRNLGSDVHEDVELEASSICDAKSWRTKQNKCDASLWEAVPMVCHLDRNSVNVDYLSTIRTMARSEMVRAGNNNKRRNRFYNYLRGVGIRCNDSLVQDACNTFLH